MTIRPPGQFATDTAEQPPFPELQRHLLHAYGDRRITFEELLNTDYPHGLWLEPVYRTAVKYMAAREGGGVTSPAPAAPLSPKPHSDFTPGSPGWRASMQVLALMARGRVVRPRKVTEPWWGVMRRSCASSRELL